MGQPKHPLYWIYFGLILLSIPAIIILIGRYEKSLSPEIDKFNMGSQRDIREPR